jgi:hypothetical protein
MKNGNLPKEIAMSNLKIRTILAASFVLTLLMALTGCSDDRRGHVREDRFDRHDDHRYVERHDYDRHEDRESHYGRDRR